MYNPLDDPPKLLLATFNKGKAREIASLLGEVPVEIVYLSSFPDIPEAAEISDTFEGNARAKAEHYGSLTGLYTVAEDAGLEIPALGGWPGVLSARVASTDADRIALVLDKMKGKKGHERGARFVSVAAFYAPNEGFMKTFLGVCQGFLTEEPRGESGFGYDPIFWHPGYGRTLAQLSTEEKNLVSHRGQSFRALGRWLNEWLREKA